MKSNAKCLAALLGSLSVVALSGCGGGTSSPSTQTVSGIVADGYLRGADVFLDKNGNKQWDEGEVKAVTKAGGKYDLVLPKDSTDKDNFPVIVFVSPTTINEDDGQPVAKEYYLSAPAGKPEVITPITTMIQNKIETGITEATAVAQVKTALGGVTVDLYKDFVAESKSATSSVADKNAYIKIYNAAQVVATKLADNLAVVKANADASSTISQLLSTAVQRVTTQLATISDLPEVKAATVMLPTAVKTLVTSSSTAIPTIEAADVKAEVAEQVENLVPVPVSSSFKTNITDGQYWVESDSYGLIKLNSDGVSLTSTEKYFDFGTKTWTDTRPANWGTETEYVLTSSGWKVSADNGSEGTVAFKSDGSATWTSKIDGSSMSLTQTAFDISGNSISKYYTNYKISSTVPTDVFPAGSKAYKMTQTQTSDTYSLRSEQYKNQSGTLEESNRVGYYNGTGYIYAKTLSDLSTMFEDKTDGNGLYLDGFHNEGSSSVTAKFSGTNTVNFYDYNYQTQVNTNIGTSTWEDKVVSGQTLRIINIPDALKTKFNVRRLSFFVVKDGYVMQGEYTKAGTIYSNSDYDFNKTAFDAILAYFKKLVDGPASSGSYGGTSVTKSASKIISKHYFGI